MGLIYSPGWATDHWRWQELASLLYQPLLYNRPYIRTKTAGVIHYTFIRSKSFVKQVCTSLTSFIKDNAWLNSGGSWLSSSRSLSQNALWTTSLTCFSSLKKCKKIKKWVGKVMNFPLNPLYYDWLLTLGLHSDYTFWNRNSDSNERILGFSIIRTQSNINCSVKDFLKKMLLYTTPTRRANLLDVLLTATENFAQLKLFFRKWVLFV